MMWRPDQLWREGRAAMLPQAGNIGAIEDPLAAMARIQLEAARCRQCVPAVSKAQWAASRGGHELPVMIVGESPGWEEARTHQCFVGPAGKALGLLLRSVGIAPEAAWLTNTVRCRCPRKSDLTPRVAANCQRYLLREVLTILPMRVVLLGRFAWEAVHGPREGSFVGLRQQWVPMPQLEPSGFSIPTMFAYHPAAGLRDGTYLGWLREDLAWLMEGLCEPLAGAADYGG